LNTDNILNNIVISYKNILKDNLVGIYVHGSLAMHCYNPKVSDIDFLVIVKKTITSNVKRKLIDVLLKLSKSGPEKGLEMSVLLEGDVKNFKYPTPYLLHYSNLYKPKYEADNCYLCENGEDPDLAAHITVTRARGICIYGCPIEDVFSTVPRRDYLSSIYYDIKEAIQEIIDAPVYIILNLCRVLYYLKEEAVSSKEEGGQWACCILPKEYVKIVQVALNCYNEGAKADFNEKDLMEFAEFMMDSIDAYMINYED